MKLPLPFATYALEARQASAKRLVNCAIEMMPDGKGPTLLRRTPGIKAWSTAGTAGRGMHVDPANGTLYAVSSDTLYKVNSAGAAISLGAVSGSGIVSMDSNVSTVVVVAEPNGYYYDGSTFGQITDVDFTSRGASQVNFLGNWLLFLEPSSGRVFGADFGTATSFNALNFFTAEGSPDNTQQIITDKEQLVQLGTSSVELAYNSGRSGFPFERVPSGGSFNLGALAKRSAVLRDNSFDWLASDLTVRTLRGVTPTRISTHAVEEAITSFSTRSDAVGMAFTVNGHLLYALTFPSAGRTFCHDGTTKQWHELDSYLGENWQPVSIVSAYGKTLVQDGATGRIGELSTTTYAYWDDPQVMQWTYASVYADGALAFHDRLEIIGEKGVGLISGQGSDPQIMLEVSDDGGKTFRMYPPRSLGRIGEYRWRVVWDRLGSSRDRAYRCSVSDPVAVTVTDTLLEVRGGRL